MDNIVSSTSDAASTQTKFTHLLEKETGKQIVENKCSMHLGVNLRLAQVKATRTVDVAAQSYGEINTEDVSYHDNSDDFESSDDCDDDSNAKLESDGDVDAESSCNDSASNFGKLNCDIDLFVHELAKLFGHLGTPEYCHGVSTFRIFLTQKVTDCTENESVL